MRITLLILAVVLSACGDDEPKAPITPGGGPGQEFGETHKDGGGTVDDTDAGSTPDAGMGEGPMPFECVRIDPVMFSSDEVPTVTATTTPADFAITRQVGTWTGDCPSPSIVVELSNGNCPNGQGHELEFWFPANGIEDGNVSLGLNILDPDALNGIRIRYTRPERYTAAGVYGDCGGATGTLVFYDPPDVTRAMNLRAKYDLMLPPCDGKPNPVQAVSGYFDVRIRRALPMVCPP
jgi:hypothetical protein